MPDNISLPSRPQSVSGFPQNEMQILFDGFETLNTKPTRPSLKDEEMFICDNFMPLGKNNLRTLYDVGAAIYTAPTNASVIIHWFGNIKTTPYCIAFLSDGSVIAVNTNTSIATTIAGVGTIQNPSPLTIGVSQWGNQYILISASQTNGYFVWDGTLLYQAGTIGPTVDITSGGYGYTSSPTITAVGGSGSGASFTSTLENGAVQSISAASVGSGYGYADTTYLAFSGGGGNTSAIITCTISGGTVSAYAIVNGGTGYTSTTTLTVSGGGGYGATCAATVSGGAITALTPGSAGESYTTPPTIIVTDPNNTVAQATVPLMPFGVKGSALETYQGHVWIEDGSKVVLSAPESVSDFGTSSGGGAFTSVDSFLRIGFTAIKQSNGFLYLLADSSMNYISGVSTVGTPATTTFSNQNVDPQIGTSWPGSVQVFSRNIVFANSFGVHVSYGGAVTKVSPQLDGIYPTTDMLGSFSPSAAVAIIFGIHVYMILLPMIDQVTGQQVNKLAMWDGKRWWTASQSKSLTWIAPQEINSQMTAYGTDGRGIYPLFQTPSTGLIKTAQSRLYDSPGYYFVKMANRVFALVNYNTPANTPITISVDNGQGASTAFQSQPSVGLTWTNNTGATMTWTNNTGAAITWTAPGLSVLAFASSQPGPLLGLTASTAAADLTLISVVSIVQNYQSLL